MVSKKKFGGGSRDVVPRGKMEELQNLRIINMRYTVITVSRQPSFFSNRRTRGEEKEA